jgi:hypothetical protein
VQDFVTKLLAETNSQLSFIEEETRDSFRQSELSIELVLASMEKLKGFTTKYKFKNKAEEVKFFKHLKPQLFSKLIYHTKVINIEIKRPKGTDKTQQKYLLNELDNLHRFFDNNLDFYQYYRTGATYLDDKYFVRGKYDIRLSLDTFFFTSDPIFNTTHDYKVSKILANDLLEVYLKEQLAALDRMDPVSPKSINSPKVKLTWTDSKVALTELLYALYHQRSINNGNIDIKEMTNYFEIVFNIHLGDVYRTWFAIRNRKIEPTSYLDSLRSTLQKKIEQEENK